MGSDPAFVSADFPPRVGEQLVAIDGHGAVWRFTVHGEGRLVAGRLVFSCHCVIDPPDKPQERGIWDFPLLNARAALRRPTPPADAPL